MKISSCKDMLICSPKDILHRPFNQDSEIFRPFTSGWLY